MQIAFPWTAFIRQCFFHTPHEAKFRVALLCFRDQIYFENSVQYLYPFEWSNNEWLLYLLLRSISWTKTSAGLISCGHTGIPRLWTLDPERWNLDVRLWTQDSGCWTLDAGPWMVHFGRWDLGTGHYRWLL